MRSYFYLSDWQIKRPVLWKFDEAVRKQTLRVGMETTATFLKHNLAKKPLWLSIYAFRNLYFRGISQIHKNTRTSP